MGDPMTDSERAHELKLAFWDAIREHGKATASEDATVIIPAEVMSALGQVTGELLALIARGDPQREGSMVRALLESAADMLNHRLEAGELPPVERPQSTDTVQ